jgi:heat shock protein HslJ
MIGFNACKSKMADKQPLTVEDNSINNTGQMAADSELVGKKWILVELAGKAIENQPEAFLQFDAVNKSVNGSLGCNNVSGFYDLKLGNRIRFEKLVITLKMCLDMSVEDELKKVLEMTDNYTITDNKLLLNRARMATLAIFIIKD